MTLTPLGQRIELLARSPEIHWNVLVENVPVWPSPPPVRALTWTDGDDRYASSHGSPELLTALCARDRDAGATVGPDSILVTNGGFDALALVARHLRSGGADRAVCAGPVLSSVADLFGVSGLEPLVEDFPTLLTEQRWRSLHLGPRDVMYVNTPHNPTGACLDEVTGLALLRDQQRYGFALVLDLVYDSYRFGPDAAASPLALVQDWQNVFAVNSFSKNYGAPGLRLGWLTGARAAVERLTAQFELERIAVSTAGQSRAAGLCRHGNAALVARVDAGRRLVERWAATNGIPLAPLRGGTQAWLDLDVGDTERFADLLMAMERTVVTTGANYHPRQPGHIRLPTGLPASRLHESLCGIAKVRNLARRC